jgi:CheY-like chemotaxis protein
VASTTDKPGKYTPAILVVDDEDYVADLIATALNLEGYNVYIAYNGQEGLDSAKTLQLDLVILDLMMPYINGEEMAETLRSMEQTRDIKIILMSAGARPRQPLKDMIFLPKPFDIDEMIGLVQDLVGTP